MHNCRRMESQFVDLLFDETDAARKLRLLTEIESCANCLGQYQSLSDSLLIFGRTAAAATPPETYWPRYSATLSDRLHAPLQATQLETNTRAPFWKRLLTAKLPVPVPVAAALVIGLIISSALALKRTPLTQTVVALSPPIESVKTIIVPVVQEKIITRTVYVEKKRATMRVPRALLPAVARANAMNEATLASSKPEAETGFFTRANLKGFQPADEMRIRVIKRNNTDEK
jgi:hypothetical protein